MEKPPCTAWRNFARPGKICASKPKSKTENRGLLKTHYVLILVSAETRAERLPAFRLPLLSPLAVTQAKSTPTTAALKEVTHTAGRISNGDEAPAAARKAATVVGRTCTEAVFSTVKTTMSRVAAP